jgi:hypothetical protein
VSAGRGAIQAVNETVDLASQVGAMAGDAIGDNTAVQGFLDPRKQDLGGFIGRGLVGFSDFMRGAGIVKDDGDFADLPTPSASPELSGRLVEGVSQTVVGFVAGGRVLRAAGVGPGTTFVGRSARAAGAGAIGDFAVFDGNEERVSNLIESVPALRNPITQFLEAKEEDPELVGRLRSSLEGAGLGIGIDALIGVLRGTKALRNGDRAGVEAALDEVDEIVSAGLERTRPQLEAAKREPAAVPEGVFGRADEANAVADDVAAAMTREDAQRLLDDAASARERSGDLDIKPRTEPELTKAKGEWTLSTYRDANTLDATLRALVERGASKVTRSDADLQFRARPLRMSWASRLRRC